MKKKVDAENDLIIAESVLVTNGEFIEKIILHKEDGIAKTLVKSLWTDNTINNELWEKSNKRVV